MIADSFFWLLWVVIAFPLAMLVLGEIILKLRDKGVKLAKPLEGLRNLVLPTLVLYIVFSKIIGWESERLIVPLAETLMWIAMIYTALSFLNLFLFEEAPEGSWQANVPKIFVDTSRFFLILVGTAIVFSKVWGQDLGGLLTALGVGSLVIGLALQDSLGNIFSGVALLFERPFRLGDLIQVGETMGKVEEITWRSVHLLTTSGHMVIVPNSELAKGTIHNFHRPSTIFPINLELGYSFDDPPNLVKSVITKTALSTEGVLSNPAPEILTSNYGDFSITYQICLYVSDYNQELWVKERFLTRIWYATKRAGLTIPYPISTEFESHPKTLTREQQTGMARKLLLPVPALSQFDDEMLNLLSRRGVWFDYAADEILISEGEVLRGMYLVISGTAKLLVTDQRGYQQTIAKVSQREFFGEKASLLNEQNSDVSVMAINDLTVLFFDKDTIQLMLEHSPRLVQELGEMMELRRRVIRSFKY